MNCIVCVWRSEKSRLMLLQLSGKKLAFFQNWDFQLLCMQNGIL